MVEPLWPPRGGFFPPFGTAEFIGAFLDGRGPAHDAPYIDTRVGDPQAEIHAAYKGSR